MGGKKTSVIFMILVLKMLILLLFNGKARRGSKDKVRQETEKFLKYLKTQRDHIL